MKQLCEVVFLLLMTTSALADGTLPLRQGYYVAEGIACEHPPASSIYGYYGDSFGMSHNGCTFASVEETGPGFYAVKLDCSDLPSADATVMKRHILVADETHFRIDTPGAFEPEAVRWCGDRANSPQN